jgi:hypothetical protein
MPPSDLTDLHDLLFDLGTTGSTTDLAWVLKQLASGPNPSHWHPDLARSVKFMEENFRYGSERPMMLLNEGSDRTSTLWLLGWRDGDATPIHDHDDSAVVVKVLKGSVLEDVYTDCSSCNHVTRRLDAGETHRIPTPYVHRVRGVPGAEGMSVTLHAYFPKLDRMSFYEETGIALNQTSTWETQS